MTDEPGRLLASGRDGDIFEFGPGLVLRRARDGRNIAGEARIMEYVGARGLPVPRIHAVRANGTEIVMDRVDGPTMLGAITRRPWRLARHAEVLADLHRRLHAIESPDWLESLPGGGDQIVHLDLHPLNVLYGSDGPVLIDWTNARRGRPEIDLAHTWLVVAAADTSDQGLIGRVGAPIQRRFAALVIDTFDRVAVAPFLRPVVEGRAADRNMLPSELAAMRRIVEREEKRAAG